VPDRAGQVRLLAALLSQREHSRPVTARWAPAHDDGVNGAWVLSWVDGPDDDTLQDWARTLTREVPDLAGLDVDTIWTERTDSPAAWAALMLAEAGPSPWRSAPWRSAAQLVAHVDDTIWSRAWLDEIEHPGDTAAVRALADLVREPGWQLYYRYDFGDDWLVTGTVEKILTRPSASTFYPRCTAGRRNGPAEDCGGPIGYHQLLTALRARKGWRYRQAREQHPGWRPEDFDRDAINQDLQRDYRHLAATQDAVRSPRPD
jgi:hypothetical protein